MIGLETTIRNIQDASTVDAAFEVFKTYLVDLGYDNAVYTLLTDHPSIGQQALHGVATDYPEDWIRYYIEQDYQQIDPVCIYSLKRPVPFFWKDAVESLRRDPHIDPSLLARSSLVMDQGAEAGVADGIGMSFINRYGEVAGFGISRERVEPTHDYTVLSTIYLAASMFHDKFLSLHSNVATPSLTEREKDILAWAAEGKSDWEIATILGIKHPTVRYHWSNIFKKLDATNRLLATAIAIQKKIVTPQSIRLQK
ncbi:LuxR family transcriptional regulator [uncultured Cohaesibacter sp.]|uniref:LuxR family transcriptional regulator n=1 Tax=uncultured Cohaesibacter sp. TaxID=1002546 RepID=UPI0029C69DBF|nr:LuxR family transcriptional regulator [uncultured Cohaesibacter sp.]